MFRGWAPKREAVGTRPPLKPVSADPVPRQFKRKLDPAKWKKRRNNAPLRTWLMAHMDDPYPSADDKEELAQASGLSYDQVKSWFSNVRYRLVSLLLLFFRVL